MFKQIIAELIGSGRSEQEIAKECGTSQATINRLKLSRVKDTSYTIGAKLVDLHKKIIQKDTD